MTGPPDLTGSDLPVLEAAKLCIKRPLGQGGFATVYAGTYGEAPVAVKVLLPNFSAPDKVAMFLREASCTAGLSHENIIRCLGVLLLPAGFPGAPGLTGPTWAMVLELCETATAKTLIQQTMMEGRRVYSNLQAYAWLIQIASALHAMHSSRPPIIHRDLKQENILFRKAPPKGAGKEAAGNGGGGGKVALLADLGLHVVVEEERSVMLRRRSTATNTRSVHARSRPTSTSNIVLGPATSMGDGGPNVPLSSHGGSHRGGSHRGGEHSPFLAVGSAQPSPAPSTMVSRMPSAALLTPAALPGGVESAVERGGRGGSGLLPAGSARSSEHGGESASPPPLYDVFSGASLYDISLYNPPSVLGGVGSVTAAAAAAAVAGLSARSAGSTSGDGAAAGSGGQAPSGPLASPFEAAAAALGLGAETAQAASHSTSNPPASPPAPSLPEVFSRSSFGGFAPGLEADGREGAQGQAAAAAAAAELAAKAEAAAAAKEAAAAAKAAKAAKAAAAAFERPLALAEAVRAGTATADRHATGAVSARASTERPHRQQQQPCDGRRSLSGAPRSAGEPDGAPFAFSCSPPKPSSQSQQPARRTAPCMTPEGGGAAAGGHPAAGGRRVSLGLEAAPRKRPSNLGPGLLDPVQCMDTHLAHNADVLSPVGVHELNGIAGGLRRVHSVLRQFQQAELKQLRQSSFEWVFGLTGRAGSCMYMSPEVFRKLPYNEKVDVFSFGVVMYELLARELLLVSYFNTSKGTKLGLREPEDYAELVCEGFRPPRPACLPDGPWALIEACWHDDPLRRPHMEDVVKRLQLLRDEEAANPSGPSGAGCACTIC